MKRMLFALLAVTAVASSSGCCCMDRLFCSPGCCGGYDMCDDCGGGCGGGECCDGCGGDMGYEGHGGGGCGCAQAPAHGGHPMVHRQRNAGGQYEFAGGPPTAGVTYPYYTTRGPRDFLASNPRSIGP